MTIVLLSRALQKVFSEVLANADFLETESGFPRIPKVVRGYLPIKQYEEDVTIDSEDFPVVIIRPADGKTGKDDDGQQISVTLIVGTYSEDFDGYEYSMIILERLIAALETLPGNILDKKYRYVKATWLLQAEQAYPLWMVGSELTFTTGLSSCDVLNSKYQL